MSSSLSSRVLNMKFMQKAKDLKTIEKRQQESQKKVEDISEWKLPSSEQILRMASRKSKIESVGYGTIMSDTSYYRKRRSSIGGEFAEETLNKEEDKEYDDIEGDREEEEEEEEEKEEKESGFNRETIKNSKDLGLHWRKRKLKNPENSREKRFHG
ncbi:hypothetical protein KGF56_003130 [Candida oxycetoniae]|uniref:Uncharacterized protein n=1 Tax=Candida oxycetoniae TaxID=497107 RepID=A0AAI9WXK5_9ASCO|nr:uncharacterized protein KGF56_003130 [Candida oxycetoniae]KAI3404094.2 hypothetical protein KGF56_003130 [Candida oxycetoniae]